MIKIAGLQKMTLMDYPGKVATSVFLAGCNFRCGFCHNPEIVEIKPGQTIIKEHEFFDFLQARQGLLDGVCVSGGEPLIYQDLPVFLPEYPFQTVFPCSGWPRICRPMPASSIFCTAFDRN